MPLGAALAARVFLMPAFGRRTKDTKPWKLAEAELVSARSGDLEVFQYGFATGEGTNLARFLATLPPNILNTAGYGKRIRELASSNGLKASLHTKEQLKKMGAGAFTAVDQGNPDSSGGNLGNFLFAQDRSRRRRKRSISSAKACASIPAATTSRSAAECSR